MINAKFYRNLVCAGLGALALSHVSLSHAYYAQASAPAGFIAGTINTFNGAKAGVTASVELGRIAANATLNVGGKAVGIATKIPYASGAARAAASLIYLHPAVRTITTVAALLGALGYAYDLAKGWQKRDPAAVPSTGYIYYVGSYSADNIYGSASSACSGFAAKNMTASGGFTDVQPSATETTCTIKHTRYGQKDQYFSAVMNKDRDAACPFGWYFTSAGCIQNAPMVAVPQTTFVDDLEANPKTPNILPELPFDLPVDVPYIEPVFIPTGNPVKNPSYDPSKPQTGDNQPYMQPGVKVDPANNAKNPFQVNVQPTNRPTASGTGSTDSQPITTGTGTETDGTDDKPKEDKDERDLCEKNPDILACQKVDTDVENEEIPKSQETVSYSAENVFGGGSCPADKYARVGGRQVLVQDWSRDCQYITTYVQPVVLVLCAMAAAGILAGALKQ